MCPFDKERFPMGRRRCRRPHFFLAGTMDKDKVRVPDLPRMKAEGRSIAMLTAYDYPFARIFDQAGIDVLLVGDSLGMVVQGAESTLPVTIDEILYHTRMVGRARRRALLVADMPFLS